MRTNRCGPTDTAYGVSTAAYLETLPDFLKAQAQATVYSLEPTFRRDLIGGAALTLNFTKALVAIGEERQIKSAAELRYIRYACDVNSDAFYHGQMHYHGHRHPRSTTARGPLFSTSLRWSGSSMSPKM
jgi:Xaa-Pro aminopeptidase